MKCTACNVPFTRAPYCNWELRNRREIDYYCKNQECAVKSLTSAISLVEPDQEVTYYRFFYQKDGEWYRIVGTPFETTFSKVGFMANVSASSRGQNYDIVTIPAPFPLDPNADFMEQILKFHQRMKFLMVYT